MERMLTTLGCLVILAVAPPATAEEPEQDRTPPGVGMGACVLPGGHIVPTDGEIPWRGLESVGPPVTKVIGKSGVPAGVVRPVRWTEYSDQGDILSPKNRMRNLNGLSLYFSSATGGFGFRLGYDRRLSPVLRLIAANEYMTYGPVQASRKLGEHLRPGVQRVTLISMPVGLMRQFWSKRRIVPHVGFGAGPYLRYDHRGGYGGYPSGGFGFGSGSAGEYAGINVRMTQWGGPVGGFPDISFTLGGYIVSGFSVRFGKNKDLAVTTDGRYTVARFSDALGNPGDLSGFSLSIGAGRYF